MKSKEHGVMLDFNQRKALLKKIPQTGMRFERIQTLPNGVKQIWLCEIKGLCPLSTRTDNKDQVLCQILETNVGIRDFEYFFSVEEIKSMTDILITLD